MHGGASGSGARPGNTNALKHGLFSQDYLKQRKAATELRKTSRALVDEID